jgi:hypothetical protein
MIKLIQISLAFILGFSFCYVGEFQQMTERRVPVYRDTASHKECMKIINGLTKERKRQQRHRIK